MKLLNLLTTETAAPTAKPILENAQSNLGFVPNLYPVLANSPLALEAYTSLATVIGKRSTFSPQEQQVAFIAASIENGCDYCVAAHSTLASGHGVSNEILNRIRAREVLADTRLEAIRSTTIALVRDRGRLSETDRKRFLDAGLEAGQLLDLLTFIALKTISNYSNHLAKTPLDVVFEARHFKQAV